MVKIAFLFFVLVLCSCQKKREMRFYNMSHADIKIYRGITYKDNLPVTGVLFSLNNANDTIGVAFYRDGRLDGPEKLYYSNGQLRSSRFYVKGWKIGEHQGWHENGQAAFLYHFEDDKFHGRQQEWINTGQPYSDMNYNNGKEDGLQRMWFADGTIKMNYIIKNNRRYGLLGTKNCINTTDSTFSKL